MGWAYDDAPCPYAPEEFEARERAADRFREAGKRAMARALFELAAALMEEAARLGARFHTWNGVSYRDTTDRFVALAPKIGV